MSGNVQYGPCSCGAFDYLYRKYFYYPGVKCNCCVGPGCHFELLNLCKNCIDKAKAPTVISVVISKESITEKRPEENNGKEQGHDGC